MKKICVVCNNEFESKKHNSLVCSIECKNKKKIEKAKQYYLKNREKIIKQSKTIAIKNKENIIKYRKDYYVRNKETTLAKTKKRYEENKNNILIVQKEYHNSNNGIIATKKARIIQKEENVKLSIESKNNNVYRSIWEIHDDIVLLDLVENGVKYKDIAIRLNRTRKAIDARIYKLKRDNPLL